MTASASSKRRRRTDPPSTEASKGQLARSSGIRLRGVPNIEADDQFEPGPEQVAADDVLDALDPDMRHRMISETAYRRHAERGYDDGYDLEDWLQAEVDVDHLVRSPRR
jgi:hypothetical protein